MRIVDIVVPEAGEEGTESVISAWLKKIGDPVVQHEPLLEVSTDKVNIEIPAPASGQLTDILKQEGEEVSPEDVVGRIRTGAEEEASPSKDQTEDEAVFESPSFEERPTAPAERSAFVLSAQEASRLGLSPSVRRLVRHHDIDVRGLVGSGRKGRLTFRDVQRHLKSRDASPQTRPSTGTAKGESRMVPHSPMRRKIADHMVNSLLRTAPHVTAVFEADMTAAAAHRQAQRDAFAAKGVRLTFSAYFVAAAVEALKAVPEINSRWHDTGLEVLANFHIGIAAAVPDGLIVPVIRNAESMDLFGLAERLQDLTERARAGKATREELQGGTLTITNHGVSGSLLATPIINQPQSAILGIGKIEKRLVVESVGGSDAVRIKPMCFVTLTVDHRALDGFHANAFLTRFVEALGEWRSA